MPGPLPESRARRRNAPTIPTTSLPVSGRKGRPPNPPVSYVLGKAGKAWWRWAWTLPQAMAWDAGALYTLARRAQLEDDLMTLDEFNPDAIHDLLDVEESAATRRLSYVVGRLKALAGGRLAVLKEMRELDNKLGLNPEALAKLRWKIVADGDGQSDASKAGAKKRPAKVRRLRAVDPVAASSA